MDRSIPLKDLNRYETAHQNFRIAEQTLARAKEKLDAAEARLLSRAHTLTPMALTFVMRRSVITIDSDGLTTKIASRKLS